MEVKFSVTRQLSFTVSDLRLAPGTVLFNCDLFSLHFQFSGYLLALWSPLSVGTEKKGQFQSFCEMRNYDFQGLYMLEWKPEISLFVLQFLSSLWCRNHHRLYNQCLSAEGAKKLGPNWWRTCVVCVSSWPCSPAPHKPGIMMLTSNSSTWELNTGSFEGHPHLYGEFEASLDWRFWLF